MATEQDCRNFLGGFGFNGDTALEPVAPFSGGEKARLVLALLVYQRPALLLLDEPTNHLDLEMRLALNMALQEFEGALVVVSHDRYFLRNVTDDLWLVADGKATVFDGDLDDYRQLRLGRDSSNNIEKNTLGNNTKKLDRQAAAQQRQKLQPLRNQVKKAEQVLDKLNAELAKIEGLLADTSLYEMANKEKLKTLLQQQAATKSALEQAEMDWLDASEILENAETAEV